MAEDDEGVFQEENRVKQQVRDSVVDPNIAVQICGLVKTYPGKTEIGCCKCRRKPHHHAVKKLLADVRVKDAAKGRAGGYSGGMTSRLSVVIVLIGNPKLVILDEPTTGMDPITLRHAWDIIGNAKKGRAIILTTHSMEEADILSDRIGIVAKGALHCIGTSIRLKSRFGSGLVTNVSFYETTTGAPKSCHEALKNFFKHNLGVVPKEENKYFQSYVVPNKRRAC